MYLDIWEKIIIGSLCIYIDEVLLCWGSILFEWKVVFVIIVFLLRI